MIYYNIFRSQLSRVLITLIMQGIVIRGDDKGRRHAGNVSCEKWLNADRLRRTEMDDICAELSLRGVANVKLPPDLLELITADMRKRFGISGQKLN
jgi:hypothetical protein